MSFCKRHNVDHYGTFCGGCVLLWKKKAEKYDYLMRKKRKKKAKK